MRLSANVRGQLDKEREREKRESFGTIGAII